MANIVVAIYNPLIRQKGMYPYFETFLNGLKNAGNNVLCFEKIAAETVLNEEVPEEYLAKIKNFKPDLFIFFNNQFWDISKYFEQPIIIYDVDSPNVYCNIDKLKKNKRYKYLTIQKAGIDIIQNALEDRGIEVKYIPPFTGIRAENIEQTINIGFCGSHWLWNDFTQIEEFLSKNPSDYDRKIAKEIYKTFQEYPFCTSDVLYKNLNVSVDKKLDIKNLYQFTTRVSGVKRLRCLLELEDLGLEIRGYLWNTPTATPLKAFPELLLSYSNKVVNNNLTTQNFYNSAKIGFNTNSIQAKSGFSWRVFDILASNACLVTEYTSDITSFGFDILSYKTPQEARSICENLLKNENLRKEYVQKAHEVIDKNHRFSSVLPIIEDFVGMKLRSDFSGTLEIVNTDNVSNSQKSQKRKLKLKDKIRYKIWKHLDKKLKKKNLIN